MPHGDKTFTIPFQITEDLTLPKVLLETAKKYGADKAAMREKEFGIWAPITWQDYLDKVKYIALGLISLGLQREDKVAMIGDNRPEGLWAEMATLAAGGIAVWLFQDSLLEEVTYIINHSDAVFLVGEGQEEVDKALSIKDRCPYLKKIIWDDPKGLRNYDDPMLISLGEVMERGRDLERKDSGAFRKNGGHREGPGYRPAVLHFRDHGPAQGGLAVPLQHVDHGPGHDGSGPLYPGRRFRVLPALRLDRRADDVHLLRAAGRVHHQFSRGAGDRRGEHPGNRPPRHVRPAPDVRADDPDGPGQAPGLHLDQADLLFTGP